MMAGSVVQLVAWMTLVGLSWARHTVRAWAPTQFYQCRSTRRTGTLRSASNLVSVEEALEAFRSSNLKKEEDGGLVFVDGSFYHKGGRSGRADFEAGPRLPGARYLDMVDVATSKELFPERNPKGLFAMLPPKELFAAAMDAFGIRKSDRVIIYGRRGCIFTPRTWFLFRTMGHENVQLMQGSLEDWKEAGGPVEEDPATVPLAKDWDLSQPTKYTPRDPVDVIAMDEMMTFIEGGKATIVDPRGSSFAKKGYMPGAKHLPYASLVEPDNQLKLKSKYELEKLFEQAGVEIQSENPIVCSCGSGVSVCHVYLALEECGRKGKTLIYDGSWNEWSQNPESPKVLPVPK